MSKLKKIKHEHFAREYIEKQGNAKQAYLEVYPNSAEISAASNSSRLIKRDNVRERIQELLENKSGSKIAVLVSDLIDLKRANKTVFIERIEKEIADNPTRLESIKVLLKLHGLLSSGNSELLQDNRSITFNLNVSDINRLQDIVKSLQQMRSRDDKISGKVE